MSNESPIIQVPSEEDESNSSGVVQHLKELSASLKTLRESDELTDSVLIVENKRFPVHRVILAARCDYFRALFYGGMKESSRDAELEVELKETPAEAFSYLLRYIYDGQITLSSLPCQTMLELVALANRFDLSALQVSVCNYMIGNLTVDNVCSTLDMAIFLHLERLHECCLRFVDDHATVILKSGQFLQLSKEALIEVLRRDSFFAPEEEIFVAVSGWCKANIDLYLSATGESPAVEEGQERQVATFDGASAVSGPVSSCGSSSNSSCSKDIFRDVLSQVRLPLMPLDSVFHTVRHSVLFSDSSLLDSLEERLLQPEAEPRYRGKLCIDKHLLDGTSSNSQSHVPFSHSFPHDNDADKCAGITIRLSDPHLINYISLTLPSKPSHYSGYRLYVGMASADGKDSIKYRLVHDYSSYHCRGLQEHHFSPCVVQYIRIVGSYAAYSAREFQLLRVNAMYTSKSEEFLDGCRVPKDNMALAEKNVVVLDGVSRVRNSIVDGIYRDYDWDSGYTCHQIDHGHISISLPQPVHASSMRLLLWDCDDRRYSYYIEVSLDNARYRRVCDKTSKLCRSWQTITFEQQLFSYVRIVGTRNTANEVFHCVHFECPSSRSTDSLAFACEDSEQDVVLAVDAGPLALLPDS